MSFVYIRSEPGLWTVGHYDQDQKFQPESDHGNEDEAARRTAWLNGAPSDHAAIVEERDELAAEVQRLKARPTVGSPASDPDDLHQHFAAELHRIADAVVTQRLPLNKRLTASLSVGVLGSRADLEQWAAFLGSTIETDDTNRIPHTRAKIRLSATHLADLTVRAQIPAERSEVEQLRAELADANAKLAAATQPSMTTLADADPKNRCTACRHESEHRLDTGCVSQTSGRRCGCTYVARVDV